MGIKGDKSPWGTRQEQGALSQLPATLRTLMGAEVLG